MFKYLKDQGGQFWGAFATSYANAVEKARDRPMKEAMMKAQIAQHQAVADKAQMDIEQARQHQQALTDLAAVLQPQQVQTVTPTEGPATEAGVGPAPVTATEIRMPDIKSPKVQGALVKAQPKEAATQLLKQSLQQQMGSAIVNSWDEARALAQDPQFQAANPYGGRWIVNSKGQIQFQGIHPVNPEAAIFHGPAGSTGAIDYAHNRSAAAAQGGVSGKAAAQLQEPVAPMQPLPGQTPSAPHQPQQAQAPVSNVGTQPQQPTVNTGESPAMRAKRQQQQITRQEGPIPEADKNALNAASKISAQADLLLKGFSDDEINKFAGVFKQPMKTGQAYANALSPSIGKMVGTSPEEQNRYSAWRTALAQLKHVAFDEGGKQLTPFEASIVFGYIPTGGELNGGIEIKQKIEQLQTFLKAGRDVRAKLAQAGRTNIDPAELDTIMRSQLSPLVDKLRAGQPKAGQTAAPTKELNFNPQTGKLE